jgi:hypothetical protein
MLCDGMYPEPEKVRLKTKIGTVRRVPTMLARMPRS